MSQAALERQIRPIYDAIEAGSNKSALQQCNKVLKKYPGSDLVKALKALACFRMNRIEECLPLCDEVLANKPTDLEVLTAMMHVLRALGRHTDLVVMYDEAFRANPSNEELGTQDFFANVRTGNWKTAQQVAQRLHKAFGAPSGPLSGVSGGDRYLYWAVLGALLQANDMSTSEAMRNVLFKLAARLLEQTEIPPYATSERMYVHITVLQALEEYGKAAALLDTEEGKMVVKMSLVVDELRREVVKKREDWAKEGERARARILDENDRNWLEFLAVVDAAAHAPEEKLQETIEDTRSFFRQIAEKDGKRDRAAPLALFELDRVARSKGLAPAFDSEHGLLGLIKSYTAVFGDKPCCYEDLRPYVCPTSTVVEGETKEGITEEERTQIVAFLETLGSDVSSEPSLQRTINAQKLCRYLLTSTEITPSTELDRALGHLRSYSTALPLGKAKPETELQPADDLVILAAQIFVRQWREEGDVKWLYMAATVLECAVAHSKSNHVCRLHLVRIYRLLSAPSLSLNHYRALLVKQIQNDTLSHFILARASTFSLAASGDLTLTQECVEASQIYVSNSQETSDFIVRAFATEKYSQVSDLISFEDKLDNSLQRDLVKIEHVRMRVAHEGALQELADTELIELKFIFDRIHHDNRDFDVLPNYQPHGTSSFNDQSNMFNSPGLGWLTTFLRIYIRVFLLASDIDDTVEEKLLIGDRPKVADGPETRVPLRERIGERKEEELSELTSDELSLFDFVSALCDWLAPYHDHARPPAEAVLAEAARQEQERLRVMGGGKGASRSPSADKKDKDGSGSGAQTPVGGGDKNGNGGANGHGQKKEKNVEEPPAVVEPPEAVTKHFDAMAARFKEVTSSEKYLEYEVLHVATLTQEAALMLALLSMRFKAPAVVKANKFGALTASLRGLRQGAATVLKEMSATLATTGANASSAEQRKAFVETCSPIQEIPEFNHDKVLDVAKRIGDARKRVIEGIAKGISKIATTQMQ